MSKIPDSWKTTKKSDADTRYNEAIKMYRNPSESRGGKRKFLGKWYYHVGTFPKKEELIFTRSLWKRYGYHTHVIDGQHIFARRK